VLLPAALPLIFGGQWGSALVTAAANVLLLALACGVIRYGLLAIVRWTGVRLFDQLSASRTVLSRAVPLLLVFALVLFINTEMWQGFSSMPS
jgi:ABC-type arginine transport system permease subunit